MTFAQLHARALTTAAGLDGVVAGERVAIALPPGDDFAVALHAIWLRGAVAVPHDLRLGEDERPDADHVLSGYLPSGDPATLRPVERHDLGAPAAVIQTSGTSGTPKPVALTFGNWLWSALGSATALRSSGPERWLCALPLSHVGGLSILVRAAISGGTAVVHERWDTQRVLGELLSADAAITLVSVVPTTLTRLLDAGLQQPPTLRCALLGGAPASPELLRRAAAAGVPVSQTYGLTETCSQVTTQRPGETRADAGAPLFCTRVRIAADGEIHVRGLTVAGTDSHAELATGDLGRLDDEGRLAVVGRKADTIITGGENVAPAEVEAVLEAHPAVAEAAVLGAPDPEWGEAVHARVVLHSGSEVGAAQLQAHCASLLAGFKVPKAIRVVPTLPRTTSGKLRRADLR